MLEVIARVPLFMAWCFTLSVAAAIGLAMTFFMIATEKEPNGKSK